MFKLRLLSAAVLLPAVVLGILFLPNFYVAIFSAIVFVLAAWEWLQMTISNALRIRALLLVLLVLVAASLLLIGVYHCWIYYISLLWWALAFVGICYYPRGVTIWRQLFAQPLIGLIIFVPAWLAFNSLHAQTFGPQWVLLGCALIWGADVGAYCFGKLWGKRKLAANVSPGKTWAGLYGALLTSAIIMLIFYAYYKPAMSIWAAIWLALITVIFAVIGDLSESMQKRIYGIKDSGKLIPGHGGVYDRIDSMLAAFPVYFVGLQILQNLRIIHI